MTAESDDLVARAHSIGPTDVGRFVSSLTTADLELLLDAFGARQAANHVLPSLDVLLQCAIKIAGDIVARVAQAEDVEPRPLLDRLRRVLPRQSFTDVVAVVVLNRLDDDACGTQRRALHDALVVATMVMALTCDDQVRAQIQQDVSSLLALGGDDLRVLLAACGDAPASLVPSRSAPHLRSVVDDEGRATSAGHTFVAAAVRT